jgi:hypothetical protein
VALANHIPHLPSPVASDGRELTCCGLDGRWAFGFQHRAELQPVQLVSPCFLVTKSECLKRNDGSNCLHPQTNVLPIVAPDSVSCCFPYQRTVNSEQNFMRGGARTTSEFRNKKYIQLIEVFRELSPPKKKKQSRLQANFVVLKTLLGSHCCVGKSARAWF